jgi:hypothetical protein
MTSPLVLVPRAHQVYMLMEFSTNRQLPSAFDSTLMAKRQEIFVNKNNVASRNWLLTNSEHQ